MPLTEAAPDALARTYAQSLFELAQAQGGQAKIEQVQGELEDVLELARSDRRFSEFLASRILPEKARGASLAKIFRGRASDLLVNFLLVLNDKGRLGHLAPIAAAFDELVQEVFGRVEVDVYTASPLAAEELESIRSRLRAVLGREPVVHPYTDGSMIGGIKFQVGDRLIDGSLSTRLRRMREMLDRDGAAAVRAKAERIIEEGLEPRHNGHR